MQHVNVKIFARQPVLADLADAIPVFHRWIQEHAAPQLLIDVADYRHVPAGPGVMLVGLEANYSLDLSGGRLGLLYNRKSVFEGDTLEQLRHAYDSALAACRRLEEEPEFRNKLSFDPGECEVIFNDRLLAPNTDATYAALMPELEAFFAKLWGRGGFSLTRIGEPKERLRAHASALASSLPVC